MITPRIWPHSCHRVSRSLPSLSGRYAPVEYLPGVVGRPSSSAHLARSELLHRQGQPALAADHARQSLELYATAGRLVGQARALNILGWLLGQLGEYEQALAHCQQALDIAQELSYRYGQAEILTHLGDTHHATGDLEAARTAWQEALPILDDLQHPDAASVRIKLEAA